MTKYGKHLLYKTKYAGTFQNAIPTLLEMSSHFRLDI